MKIRKRIRDSDLQMKIDEGMVEVAVAMGEVVTEAVEPKIGMVIMAATIIDSPKMIDLPPKSYLTTQVDKPASEEEGDSSLHPKREASPMVGEALEEVEDFIQANLL